MQEYIMKPNDTMSSIAKEFKIPLAQLIKANPQITNPRMIHEGQTIMIPDLPPIPEQLTYIETAAETIIDDIYVGNWEEVSIAVNQIKAAMNALVPFLQEAAVDDKLISGLSRAIRDLEQNVMQKKAFSSISQANRITQYIADILDYFKVNVPTEVNRLGYFGRQIIINVELNDWAEARQNYLRAKDVWDRLKPELHADFSQDASEFDQVLNELMRSINQRDYRTAINAANAMLDLVDALFEDFMHYIKASNS